MTMMRLMHGVTVSFAAWAYQSLEQRKNLQLRYFI